jgi:uncharacterized membrane protein SirB2
VTTYTIALFLHFLAVVAAFGATSVLHSALFRMHKARRAAEARDAVATVARVAPRMPIFALALFLTGAWLTIQSWQWSAPWIDAGIVGLVVMVALGGVILRPRLMALRQALGEGEGPLTAEQIALSRNTTLWVGAMIPPMIATGIMFDMVTKPSMGMSLVFIAIAMAIGAVGGLRFARMPKPA